MKSYVYTAAKIGTSTAERKLTRITPGNIIANPFSIWTTDSTEPAIVTPTQTDYVTAHRARNNRATRKALAREKATILAVSNNGRLAA